MNKSLTYLIDDYLNSVTSAVSLMSRSGIPIPYSRESWVKAELPKIGELDGGIPYLKHGAGCEVSLKTGIIDFDFGRSGEIDEIEYFRLLQFAGKNLAKYGFTSEAEVEKSFKYAVESGCLTCVEYSTYHITDRPRLRAREIDPRLPGDSLPPNDQDIILTIHLHNFLPAELMYRNYKQLDRDWGESGKISCDDEVDCRIYLFTWLGFLSEACKWFKRKNIRRLLRNERPEAFKELIEKADTIIRMASRHERHLQEFRNNVFHLPDFEITRDYFNDHAERLPWSHQLHKNLSTFFSRYRVLCTVHYALNGRKGELRSFLPNESTE